MRKKCAAIRGGEHTRRTTGRILGRTNSQIDVLFDTIMSLAELGSLLKQDGLIKSILPGASLVVALLGVLSLLGLLVLLLVMRKGVHVRSVGGALGGGDWRYELSPAATLLLVILASMVALLGLGYESTQINDDPENSAGGNTQNTINVGGGK
ncbi:MAG: hypothetical protein JNK87_00645 [Bryobacterales bacterium]|nr:hypothetical protein [Bryobacterales bacterium]